MRQGILLPQDRVTAAIYWGFYLKLRTLLLFTFQHRAGVRLHTSCYHLTESCVFNKQSLPLSICRFPNLKMGKHPFSRGYEVILPSSFNIILSSALVYSTCSPMSIWGTVYFALKESKFSQFHQVFSQKSTSLPNHSIHKLEKRLVVQQPKQFRHFCVPIRLSPFGFSLGTDSLCVDLLNVETLELLAIMFFT